MSRLLGAVWQLRLPAVLAGALGACEAAPPRATIAVDSAGVRVVVSDPYRSDAMCSVSEEPLLVIGNREDDDAHLLSHVDGAARLSDGSVAVVDGTLGEVRVFDDTGEHVRSMGRIGEGPGEFRNAWYIWALPGDTLWVGDYYPWRYNVFAPDGEWLRAVEMDPTYINNSRGGGVLANATSINSRLDGDASQSFETPDTLVVEVHGLDGKLVGEVAHLPHRRMGQMPVGPPNFLIGPLFDAAARVSAFGDRIAMGTTDKPEVRILDSEYRLATIVRWEDDDREVSEADVGVYRDELRVQWDQSRYAPAVLSRERPVAKRFPAFSDVLVGADGNLWVMRYRRPGVEVRPGPMVFAPTGEFLCHMEAKRGYTLLEAGADYVLGLQEDELDIPWIVLHSFGPPGPSM